MYKTSKPEQLEKLKWVHITISALNNKEGMNSLVNTFMVTISSQNMDKET
jgi:hypothetical protein